MGTLTCPFCCGGSHTTEENLRDHLMYVLYKPDRCPICRDDYFYPNKLEFIQHFILEHKEKGSSEKKVIQNTSGYVSITTSGTLQKNLTLLPARDILYQRDKNQNAEPTQDHPPEAVFSTEVDGKKNGYQIPDERSSHVGAHQPKVLETKEFSLESHRNQVEESLSLQLYKCNSCGEMIRGQTSYLKHIQEQHLKKSNLSSNNDNKNTNISAFCQPSKSFGMYSLQFRNSLNRSPQSFYGSSASSVSSASDSPKLQHNSPKSSSQVPLQSSSSPDLCLPKNPSPNLISPMQQGSPGTSFQNHNPSLSLNKSWTPTISEKVQERNSSPVFTASNIETQTKYINPEQTNDSELYYGDAGSWIPRNWCLEKVKVKGPLTPGSHSIRSQTSSVNSPTSSEQSIRSGKGWLSSINSPASSEQSGRERFSNMNSPASSEFSYRSGKNLSSLSINSPVPSEQSIAPSPLSIPIAPSPLSIPIAPSPLSIPRYLDANSVNIQESENFNILSHKPSLGYNTHVRSIDQGEQLCKDVNEDTNAATLLGNQNIYLPLYLPKSQVLNTSVVDETCSINPADIEEDIIETSSLNQETFKQTYHKESDVVFSSVNDKSSLEFEKNEVEIKNKDLISQSEDITYSSSNGMKIQPEFYQNKDIVKDKKRIESKIFDFSENYMHQEPQSLQVVTQSIEDHQNPDNYLLSSPELLCINVENSPSIYNVASPLLQEVDISDTSCQEGMISNIEKVVVDVDPILDEQFNLQPFIIPIDRGKQDTTTSMPTVQLTESISQESFDLLRDLRKESFEAVHKEQNNIISAVDKDHKESNSDPNINKLEANDSLQKVSSDPIIEEEQTVPQECTSKSHEFSQETISSVQIPTFQASFLSVDKNNLENIQKVEENLNINIETLSKVSTESITSSNTQVLQENDRSKLKRKICDQENEFDKLLVVSKTEHQIMTSNIEHESKVDLSQNTIQMHDEDIIQDYDTYDDIHMRLGRENMDSYPHKKFRPDQERSNMQSLNLSVCLDQERNNMQSLTLAKLNRTYELDPSELTEDETNAYEIDSQVNQNEGKEEYLNTVQSFRFICKICGQGFQNQNDCNIHYKSHEISNQNIFSLNDQLENVARKKTKGPIEKRQVYKCDQCSKVFKKKYTLIRHNEEVHATNKAFTCEICSKEFSTKRSLENHNDTHLTEKNHKCPQCPHICQTAGGLRSHISEIHNDVKNKKGEIKCNYPDCPEKFSKMYGLKRHIARKHSTARLFGCNLCPSKFFSCKEDLNNHCQSHTNSESMRCKECDKQFTSFWALQRHTLSHNKSADKFKCPECSQLFTRRDSLVTHTKSKHTTNKSHECETCGLKFVRKNQLQVHQNKKTHTAEPQFSCDYCPKKFRFKDSYKRHITDKSCVKKEFI